MAWLRTGDDAATDERVLAVAELDDADERSVDEVFGFVTRLFIQAAQKKNDYQVSLGTAILLSPHRYGVLLDQAQRAGLLEVVAEEGRKIIRLVEDAEFFHLRSRETMQWEADRKADTSNLELVLPVRLRDGDACRYCGNVVAWGDQKGGRGGTYDHLIPGQRARTPDELVVACRACNGGRRDAKESRDHAYTLFPPPRDPYFSKSTITWLEQHGSNLTQLGLTVPKRPRGARDRRPGTQTRTDLDRAAQRPAAGPETAEHAAPAPSGDQRSAASRPRPAHAAPHTSGEQRAGAATEAPSRPATDRHQRPAAAAEHPETATSTPSEGTRSGHGSALHAGPAGPSEVGTEFPQNPGATRRKTPDQSLPDSEADGSGFSGSGRDGTGRVGSGRDGGPRPQGAPAASPGGRRRKRGRRRKS